MNFRTFQLGVALSLIVLIQNCHQTFAAPKPCKGGCTGTSYNSGYTGVNPAVISTPLATAGNNVANVASAGVPNGAAGADILGNNNVLKTLLDLLLTLNIPINILSST